MNQKQLEREKETLAKKLRILKPKKNLDSIKTNTKQLEEEAKNMEEKLKELQTIVGKEKDKNKAIGNIDKRWANTNGNIPLRNYAAFVMEARTSKQRDSTNQLNTKDEPLPQGLQILSRREKAIQKEEKIALLKKKIEAKMSQMANPQANTNTNQKTLLRQNSQSKQKKQQQQQQQQQIIQEKKQEVIEQNYTQQINQSINYQQPSPQKVQVQEKKEELSLNQFLMKLNLLKYEQIFLDNGFDELEILVEIEKEHLEEMKIPLGHQIKILKDVKMLKQMYDLEQNQIEEEKQRQQEIIQKQKEKEIQIKKQKEQKALQLKKQQDQIEQEKNRKLQQELLKIKRQNNQTQEINTDIVKQTCWCCFKSYYEDNIQNVFTKNYCSEECYQKYYQQNYRSCGDSECSQSFYILDGINKNGQWYCAPKCVPNQQQLLEKEFEEQMQTNNFEEESFEKDSFEKDSLEKDSLEKESLEEDSLEEDKYQMIDNEQIEVDFIPFEVDLSRLEDKYKEMNINE